jgi:peptide/nickel transport system permease protein
VTHFVRQLFTMAIVLAIVSFLAFALMHLVPGDPVLAMVGEDASLERVEQMRRELGFDRPMVVQYGVWLGGAVQGDLGRSVRTGQPITEMVLQRAKPTLQMILMGTVFAVLLALPVGILAAARRNSFWDSLGTTLAMAGLAMPNFWLGILLMLLFSVWLGWLPALGYVDPFVDLGENLRRMIMPSVALGLGLAAEVLRQTRSSMLEVLNEDYIRTARSYGASEGRVLWHHALRNAMIPVITTIGMNMGRLFGGAVVTEFVFAVPGVGRLVLDSVFARDYPAVQGVVILMSVGVLISYLLVDLAYTYLDPRVRF